MNEHVNHHVLKTPSPPPTYTSPVHNNGNNEEVQHLKAELDTLKQLTLKLSNDYKQLQNETRTQKQTYDDQITRLQKKLKDLVDEIDDEKKTRLALQVELERIKKSITTV